MASFESRDRAEYAKLETGRIEDVKGFLEQIAGRLETAELTVRRSAETYIVELRPTNLSDHFKSGQRLSLQNRPTGLAVQD